MKRTTKAESLRPALPGDCDLLSEIALRSKGYWGYDDQFLEDCRNELTVDPDLLDRAFVRTRQLDGHTVGFYALVAGGEEGELQLEHFWLEPAHIGLGLGRAMWSDAIRTAADLGCTRILIHSDPYAEPFYRRMGADRVGYVASASIRGRELPLMRYHIRR